ncbi:hypothetical protein TB1_042564 [Malus domestica]
MMAGWRKNATLPQRVETSRRSRRCLLMSLALAKTSVQQRTVVSVKDAAWTMFCGKSMRHFNRAFAHKQDWSHAYYIGKLCEKLKFFSYETSVILLQSYCCCW